MIVVTLGSCSKSRDKMLDGRWKTTQDLSESGMALRFIVEFEFNSEDHTGSIDLQYFVGGVQLTSCHAPMTWSLADSDSVIRLKVDEEAIKFTFSPEFSVLSEGTDISQADLDKEMRSQMKATIGRWGEEKIQSISEDKMTLSEAGFQMVYYRVK